MSRRVTINGIGCSLADVVYTNVDFGSTAFARFRSHSDGDGGLAPGKLVFTEELEKFAGTPLSRITDDLAGDRQPDAWNLGGPAIVALIHAAQMLHDRDIEVRFHGIAGTDETGDAILRAIQRTPVHCEKYRRIDGPSPSTTVLSDPAYDHGHGERCFVNTIGAAWNLLPADIPDSFFDANIVLFGATALVPEIHRSLGALLRRSKSRGCITVVTTVYDFLGQKKVPGARWPLGEDDLTYQSIDLLVADHEEALRLSGATDAREAVQFFLDHGVSACVITHGAQPVHAASDGRLFAPLPCTELPVSAQVATDLSASKQRTGDTTGCGDNFAGGILASLAEQLHARKPGTLDTIDACAWSMAAGGFACFYMGGTYFEQHAGQKRALVQRYYDAYRTQIAGLAPSSTRPTSAGKLVLFGAGNIGRSFIGQLFSRAGYEVVFVDVVRATIDALNREHAYRVIVKDGDAPDRTIWVRNVRAVDARDADTVAAEIADATIIVTSVGKAALTSVLPLIARGLVQRRTTRPNVPVDIIIAENMRDAASFFRTELTRALPSDYPLAPLVGLVETSIGKMVPIMRRADIERDPLWVFAEAYNTLIVDRKGFRGTVPAVDGLEAKDNMAAFVDRKLFIHNLGHAAAAYLGYAYDRDLVYVYEALAVPQICDKVRLAMQQSAVALYREYPDDLPLPALHEHIDDLLHRFQNKALGDTIFRVGRDLYRKLDKTDRLLGALLLAEKHRVSCDAIAEVFVAACRFQATDEQGRMADTDRDFSDRIVRHLVQHVLLAVCKLSEQCAVESRVMQEVLAHV